MVMSNPITGGCLCGAVSYASDGPILVAAICHCADCRRCTGSAFNVSVALPPDGFRITKGVPKGFTKLADSGMP
jgi:hypothetical protein